MYPNRNCEGKLYLTTTSGGANHSIFDNYYQTITTGNVRSCDGTITVKGTTIAPIKYYTTTLDIYKDYELPKKYIINDKVCVLVWEDGSMTKIKKSTDDEFDPVKAFLWAWFQHTCDLPKWKANNYLREVEENCINNITKKKPKKKKEIIEEL